jgi:carbonic anhydrase
MKMKILSLLLCIVFCSLRAQTPPLAETPLDRLIEGNKRFVENKSLHPNRTLERREETAKKQEPFAVIVGCSDSRVAPEILFDQGIGDLFIVRVAGNVAGPLEIASIEYSALYLHSRLILVLGHENCGAVSAIVEGTTKNIEPIASLIEPAVKTTAKMPGNRLENAIKKNVALVVEQLQNNPYLKELIEKEHLLIKGGYYNFHTGKVEIFK